MATTEQTVSEILEETIEALARFDTEKLRTLEERVMLVAGSGVSLHATRSLLERRSSLEQTLDRTGRNLGVVTRLCAGKGAERWER